MKLRLSFFFRHSRENGSPFPAGSFDRKCRKWIPAFAGMTMMVLGAPACAKEGQEPTLVSYEVSQSALELAHLLDPKSLGGFMVVGDIATEAATIEHSLHNQYSAKINSKCDQNIAACATAAKRISREAAKVSLKNKKDLVIRLYATAFDEKLSPIEIDSAITFFSSQEGRKFAEIHNSIASDSLESVWKHALSKPDAGGSKNPISNYQRKLFTAFTKGNSNMLEPFLLQFDSETKNLTRSKRRFPRPTPPPPARYPPKKTN